eukprot:FR737281.1.p2 GENE.FR737281.1~~FR737281.1.p2  ORF type:complete len:247 (+),score=44.99 FR737281.1:1-741(+)
MLFTEDLPELIISLIYLFKRGSEADPFFFVSLVTTMFHALRQIFEIYHTNLFRDVNAFLLKHMRYEGKGKSFEDASKTLQTYGMYVSEVVLESCSYTEDKFLDLFKLLTANLTTINLGGCREITDKAIMSLAENCPGLTMITLRYCEEITDEAVMYLADKCHGLTTIDLTGCGRKITDKAIMSLAENCRGLTKIYLYDNKITDKAVMYLAENCPGLTMINLNGCREITDKGVAEVRKLLPKARVIR